MVRVSKRHAATAVKRWRCSDAIDDAGTAAWNTTAAPRFFIGLVYSGQQEA